MRRLQTYISISLARLGLAALLLNTLSSALTAQTPTPASPAFEVASVRMVGSDHGDAVFPKYPSAQFVAENMSLTILIALAYGISDNEIIGKPAWLDNTLYSIHAKPEGSNALTEEQYEWLLRDLLKQRFKLNVHREVRSVPGYALTVSPGGLKLKRAVKPEDMSYIMADGLRSSSVSLATLASLLSRPLERPVTDKTGMAGKYQLDLRFAPEGAADSNLPSIFTAVQEQLGLKLESQKVQQPFLVIDHVEKIPTEN